MSAIEYRDVTFGYPDGPTALDHVELDVTAGDVLLVIGSSGSGKSTLLRAANGLVPHASGGRFGGAAKPYDSIWLSVSEVPRGEANRKPWKRSATPMASRRTPRMTMSTMS